MLYNTDGRRRQKTRKTKQGGKGDVLLYRTLRNDVWLVRPTLYTILSDVVHDALQLLSLKVLALFTQLLSLSLKFLAKVLSFGLSLERA